MRRPPRRALMAAPWLIVAVLLGLLTTQSNAAVGPTAADPAPNIVFVLTDDLSWNLVPYLPQVAKMRAQGMTFDQFTVTDSLCCPSRASILTGQLPHNTGVFTNSGDDGGFRYFHDHGKEAATFATELKDQGYRTAFMGKYLNQYKPANTEGGAEPYVPPGWTEWDGAGDAYREFNYKLNENHTVVPYGHQPADYLTDVLAGKGAAFIKKSAAAGKPFLLEVATFAPHAPYTPAPRDADAFPGLTAPQGGAYDALPTDPPAWLAGRAKLTAAEREKIDTVFRKRAQAVQAVDDLIARLRAALSTAGVAQDTYLLFGSDNGFHLGDYRLTAGKMTAYDTDVRVPLVVVGPDVPAGRTSSTAVANIDLAPTFLRIAGRQVPEWMDGHSMLPLLRGGAGADWRTANLIEHHGPVTLADDPDVQVAASGNPPSYEALRTATYTYVEYADGSREYYDRASDPDELHNLAGTLPAARLRQLHAALTALVNCHGNTDCWSAGHV